MSRFSRNGQYCYHTLATFSEETVVLADAAVKIRDDAPLEKACLIGCAVATGVCVVINRAKVEAGSTVAIFGCGGVGLNAVQGAVLSGASKIIAVDKVDFKLQKAEEMGATHFVNADREDPVRRVREITDGGADYAFDIIGLLEVLTQAYESLGPGGTAVTIGLSSDLSLPGGPLGQDRTVMGTYYGAARPRVDFHWLLDMYMDGRLKVDELITKYRPLAEVNEAFDDMNAGVTARTVLTFD
jgi:S-(hydroxymethyl)glutathione dehydrogenase/alcohol dehydrogenase